MATKSGEKNSKKIKDNISKDQEISRLKDELKNMQQLYQQLTEEKKVESYDIRRTYMLKAQILQLERQCLLFSEALSSRSITIKEIENGLITHTEKFQELLAKNGPNVVITKLELVSHIQNMQRLKSILHKQDTLNHPENVTIPQLSGLKFAKPEASVTCIDVCGGNLKHINLKHIGALENKLVSLYQDLEGLQAKLLTLTCNTSKKMPEQYLFSDSFNSFKTSAELCTQNLQNCCHDLLSVSLLHPNAPWSVINAHTDYDLFSPNKIMARLPSTIRSKPELKSTLLSMCKAHNYTTHMYSLKIKSLRNCIDQNSRINRVQAHHMNFFIEGLTKAYINCEKNIVKAILRPIGEIINSWKNLRKNDNEVMLKHFLTTFKQNETALQNFSDTKLDLNLQKHNEHITNPFQDFGLELEKSIKAIQLDCIKQCQEYKEETVELTEQKTKAENELMIFLTQE